MDMPQHADKGAPGETTRQPHAPFSLFLISSAISLLVSDPNDCFSVRCSRRMPRINSFTTVTGNLSRHQQSGKVPGQQRGNQGAGCGVPAHPTAASARTPPTTRTSQYDVTCARAARWRREQRGTARRGRDGSGSAFSKRTFACTSGARRSCSHPRAAFVRKPVQNHMEMARVHEAGCHTSMRAATTDTRPTAPRRLTDHPGNSDCGARVGNRHGECHTLSGRPSTSSCGLPLSRALTRAPHPCSVWHLCVRSRGRCPCAVPWTVNGGGDAGFVPTSPLQ